MNLVTKSMTQVQALWDYRYSTWQRLPDKELEAALTCLNNTRPYAQTIKSTPYPYMLNNSMKLSSSWEDNNFQAPPEIPRILWNP
jgi:hypothetical protein